MNILAIDPGTTESGWVVYSARKHQVLHKGVTPNPELLGMLEEHEFDAQRMAVEMIASQGMAVGAETFETVVWIGIFMHAWGWEDTLRITRNQVKVHVCGSAKAKDANVRQALIDLFPGTGAGKTPQVGTSKQPGPLFGMNSHMWPALAVAIVAAERLKKEDMLAFLGERERKRVKL